MLKDVLKTQDEQLEILKKQSKQAERYKNIQKDITRARATVFYQKWQIEKNKLEETTQNFDQQNNLVVEQTQIVASMNIKYEKVQQSLPEMRLEENKIAAELQRNTINLDNQEKEIERANTAVEEIQIALSK